jgi:hypothetical protein
MSEEEARTWPDLIAILEAKVKPERDSLGGNVDAKRRKEYWWQWGRYTPALFDAIRDLARVLVISQVTAHYAFAFLPNGSIYSHRLIVFPLSSYAAFAAMQARVHEVWTRFFTYTLEERLCYAPADCFETFAFPREWQSGTALEQVGREYYAFRADLMVRNGEGLTKTYNRFHDPDELDPEIVKLRDLHAAMDRAVLDAYGWSDIQPTCEFILDYEDDEDDEPGKASKKKKPWRYRWPEEIRDEVLGRLLELNSQRASQEEKIETPPTARRKPKKSVVTPLLD